MKIRVGDLFFCSERNLLGQVMKITGDDAIIIFVTGDRINKKINNIVWNKNHWRIND
tara:strand:+ start:2673 stop:2843 length:171 start_codon:yes stop_codon:yes gene_type:complete